MKRSIIISLVISILLIGGTAFVVSEKSSTRKDNQNADSNNVYVDNGTQYITIYAKGGYKPRLTEIKGGLPTKLIVKTNGTFDCSIALSIRSLGFRKTLQPTGEEIIDLGVLKSGETIEGVCSMGMYSFKIKVS